MEYFNLPPFPPLASLIHSKILVAAILTILLTLICRNPNKTASKDRVIESIQRFHTSLPVWQLAIFLCYSYAFGLEMTLKNSQTGQWTRMEITAVVLCVLASVIRLWCYATLGRLFTFDLAIRSKHKLITTGPYAWVRHPSYTTMLLALLGYVTFFSSQAVQPGYLKLMRMTDHTYLGTNIILGLALFPVMMVLVVLIIRIPKEEAMLAKEFKGQWTKFAASRKRLIPFVY